MNDTASSNPETAPETSSRTTPRQRRLGAGGITAVVLGLLLVLALIAGGLVFLLTRGGDDDQVVTLQRVPLSTSTAAFTPPSGTDTEVVAPPAVAGLQTVPAQTAGLFGGTLNISSCDKAKLISFLAANPEKAGPWARTLGISAAAIPTYVTPLTPVLLRSDTAVTNHGFENGNVTSFPAVLQAGTSVLVDGNGTPVVRCYCGNPLTAAPQQMAKASYVGPTWPAFRPGTMTVVRSAPTKIANFVLVDVVTNQTFVRPAATDGTKDTPGNTPVASPTPNPTPSTPTPDTPRPSAPTSAPAPVPSTSAESGREAESIELTKNKIRACAATVATEGDFESVLAKASFAAEPTELAGEYQVTMTDTSGTFVYKVNVDSATVTAVSADAVEIAGNCPGVFS